MSGDALVIPSDPPAASSGRVFFWLALVLLVATAVRLFGLTSQSYVLDEDWSLEIATGRGSVHLNLPTDQVIAPPPPFYSFGDAPWWPSIWTHMEVTHPPLYPILLRFWVDVVGDSDYGGRLFSVIFSVLGVGLLFDTVRLQCGVGAATWAGLLMGVAQPQVDYARLTRSYPMLIAIALMMANVLTRMQLFGATRRRWVMLTAAILATLMTHYFCLGAVVGLMIYAVWMFENRRRPMFLAFAVAGVIFGIIWGPWMWEQRHLFATDDPSTIFLTGDAQGHTKITFLWFLSCPAQLLFPHTGLGLSGALSFSIGVILYLSPYLKRLRFKNAFSPMWGLWLLGTIGLVAFLDMSRGTEHLRFVRYTLLGGPAVYALIPTICLRWRAVAHAMGGVALVACVINLPAVYNRAQIEPRELIKNLITKPGPGDLFVTASQPKDTIVCDIQVLLLSRYMRPEGCPLAILTKPAGEDVIAAARKSRLVFLDIQEGDYHAYFPDARVLAKQSYHGLGNVFTLQFGEK